MPCTFGKIQKIKNDLRLLDKGVVKKNCTTM